LTSFFLEIQDSISNNSTTLSTAVARSTVRSRATASDGDGGAAGALIKSRDDMDLVDEVSALNPPPTSLPLPGSIVDEKGKLADEPRRRRTRSDAELGRSRTTMALARLVPEVAEEESRSCCRCGCCQELLKMELCGFPLPKVGMLLASVAAPVLDALSDWAVTYSFYANGDMGWFQIGLTIQLIGGLAIGMAFLVILAIEYQHSTDDDCDEILPSGITGWLGCCCIGLGCVAVGVSGLAPVAVAAWTLKHGHDGDDEQANSMLQILKGLKVMELICEALPQSLLQSYVGVSYGKFNPSAEEYFKPSSEEPDNVECSTAVGCGAGEICMSGECGTLERSFDPLLSASVCLSLFSAASTLFGIEMMSRNDEESALVTLASRYGVATLLLRAAQFGSTIFGIGTFEPGFSIDFTSLSPYQRISPMQLITWCPQRCWAAP
jgi:hypothetical protein